MKPKHSYDKNLFNELDDLDEVIFFKKRTVDIDYEINKKKLFYCFIKEISILGIIILVWSLSSKNILDYSNIFVIVFYSFIFIYLIYLYKTIKKQMKDLGNFADKLLSENP